MESIGRMLAAFDHRRKLMHVRLNQIPGVSCLLAQGAFYLFPNISSFGLSSQDFCARLLEKEKVAAVPGVPSVPKATSGSATPPAKKRS